LLGLLRKIGDTINEESDIENDATHVVTPVSALAESDTKMCQHSLYSNLLVFGSDRDRSSISVLSVSGVRRPRSVSSIDGLDFWPRDNCPISVIITWRNGLIRKAKWFRSRRGVHVGGHTGL